MRKRPSPRQGPTAIRRAEADARSAARCTAGAGNVDYHPRPLARAKPIAVLFDLDGTLVDTVPFILASVRHAFEGYGTCPTDAEWIAGIGTPLRTQLASFARRPADVEPLFERYRAFWLENHDRETSCFPGALAAVREIASRGHPIGIVTAKIEQGAYRTLRHTAPERVGDVRSGRRESSERRVLSAA